MAISNTVKLDKYFPNPAGSLLNNKPSQQLFDIYNKKSPAPVIAPVANGTLGFDATNVLTKSQQGVIQPPPTQNLATSAPPPPVNQAPPLPNPPQGTSQTSGLIKLPDFSKIKAGLVDPNSYQGLLQDLRVASQPNSTQQGLVKNLSSTARGNDAIAQEAQAIADKYAQEYDRVDRLGRGAVGTHLSTGSNLVGSGNAAIASQSVAAHKQAIAQEMGYELQGNQQQLTAQGQAASAYGQALGGANTQQGQQISGLNSAGSLAQPVQVPYGNQFINPATGQSAGGAGLGGYAGFNSAQQAISLGGQYPDGGYQYDPALSPQQNLQNSQHAAQGSPTYQKGVYGAPGATNVAQGTQIQTAQAGSTQSSQAYNALRAVYVNADNLSNNVINILEHSGVNPTSSTWGNKTIADIKRQFSSTEQATFDAAFQEMKTAFRGLIESYGGQTPTDVGDAYATLINPNAKLGAINASIQQMKLAGNTRLQSAYGLAQTYYSQLPGAGGQGGGGGGIFDY